MHNYIVIWDNNIMLVRMHVGNDIERDTLKTYGSNIHMGDQWLRRTPRKLLHMCGFGIFTNTNFVLQIDTKLIIALEER